MTPVDLIPAAYLVVIAGLIVWGVRRGARP